MRLSVLALFALFLLAAASCEDDPGPATTGSGTPMCGNGVTEVTEACDPDAQPATWTCPGDSCSSTCSCVSDAGGGGAGASGGEGGMGGGGAGGGVGAGLPIEGPGTIACEPPTGTPGALALEEVASGFDRPVLAIAPPGESTRLYVVEQTGRVLLYEDGSATTFLDLSELVKCCGEQGLLGLAFHPDYAKSGRLFVHYSDVAGGTVIAEYQRDPNDPDVALPDPVGDPILTEDQPASNHNGGSIEISPIDGFLYVALGDGGGGGDTFGHGQNLDSRLGAILRIDISGATPTPAGNYPGGDTFLWDVGLRNPWRTSFDPCNGDLYIGDVGQGAYEEIDVEPAGMGNRNYGWNIMEGTHCFEPPAACDMTGLTMPAVEYEQVDGNCSVTGGYVYRGHAIPWLRGTYFYGDYCTGRIWSFVWDGANATNQVDRSAELDSAGNMSISSFGQDASGEIYVTDLSGGRLYRLVSR